MNVVPRKIPDYAGECVLQKTPQYRSASVITTSQLFEPLDYFHSHKFKGTVNDYCNDQQGSEKAKSLMKGKVVEWVPLWKGNAWAKILKRILDENYYTKYALSRWEQQMPTVIKNHNILINRPRYNFIVFCFWRVSA